MKIDASTLRTIAAMPPRSIPTTLLILAGQLEADEQRLAMIAARTARYRSHGGGQISDELRTEVFARDGYACVYCGGQEHLQCDHVEPVSKGGPTTLENLATACRVCNAKKRDRDRKFLSRSKDSPRNVRGQAEDTPSLSLSPTPPNLNPSPKENPPKGGQKKRGTRFENSGFVPEPSSAEAEGLSRTQAEREARKFADYWRGVAGANGVKLDWPATWRNWCRRAAEHLGVEARASADGTMVPKSDHRWQFLTARWERENGKPFPKLAERWPFPELWLVDANMPDLPTFLDRRTRAA